MLVLSRKTGDSLWIDDRIKITVTKVKGNRVSLGIEAPDDVPIRRGELERWAISTAAIPELIEQPETFEGDHTCSV